MLKIDESSGEAYVEVPIYVTKHKDLSKGAKDFYIGWLLFSAYFPNEKITYQKVAKQYNKNLQSAKKYYNELVKHNIIERVTLWTTVGKQ